MVDFIDSTTDHGRRENSLIEELKRRARRLHRQAQQADPAGLDLVRQLPSMRELTAPEIAETVRRRHCLAALATALGFRGWPNLKALLETMAPKDQLNAEVISDLDYGTVMYRDSGGSFWNIWSASYDEAQQIRSEHGGFLLAYRRQFMVVEHHFVRWLGSDPDDEDWTRIGRDWVRPADFDAWARLTARAIERRLGPA